MQSTPRQFHCRDDLWVRVEALAERRGLTPDQVLEAALVRLFTRPPVAAQSAVERGAQAATSPSNGAAVHAAAATAGPLFVCLQGEWHMVDKDRFVIGRGAKHADLAIRDANISRQHCEIVRTNGQYVIRDLGSTNGIEVGGIRVESLVIEEGGVCHLCEHELMFSFQPPQ
ncbi:MAG: FHA domain-containing protein [Myxococcales bacterium FL481]|nr:MAG: FHA domain-containing protein [Myxococcales bacterium FL481]